MALNRTYFNALVDGDEFTGTLWNKQQIKDVILDPVDAEITVINAAVPHLNLSNTFTLGPQILVANSGTEVLELRGRASDNIATFRLKSNSGATLYGLVQSFPTNGGQLAMGSAAGPQIVIDSTGINVSHVLAVNGFGSHAFSASGSGTNEIYVVNTSSGAGNAARVRLTAGSVSARFQMFSESYTTGTWDVQGSLVVFSDGAGGVGIVANHASGAIRFYSGGATERWQISSAGYLLPGSDSNYNIGSTSLGLNLVYITGANPIYAPNMASNAGTTVVVNASGYYNKLSSSARYKEHLEPWTAPDALDRFVALSPKLWDYTGQQNGAAGFVAEDLDALDIRNTYGRSVLVNYDADGRPESNRDYALIGLQHLVIQDLWRRVAALEGRL
jgi:hypothetical protein